MRDRLPHPPVSPLFVPGDRPERFAKAASSAADAVIIDLEDAVDPANKAVARHNLTDHAIREKPVYARINAAGTPHWAEDLAAIREAPLAGIMLPKAERAADLKIIADEVPGAALIPLVETVAGLDAVAGLLGVQNVTVVAFGSIDFSLDLGCQPGWEELLLVRSQLVLASHRAGKAAPIDGVTTVIDDPAAVEADARRARSLGLGGKLAIHPRQVAPILMAFRPSESERIWAERVIAAVANKGAAKVDGHMIDKPILQRARRIVDATK